MLNPQKQMANIGATPTTGAAIPLYNPRIPYKTDTKPLRSET